MDMFAINTKVQSALGKFQQHRLVFWYDDKAEMNTLFESLQISEAEKIVIANNEFTLKHRILIEQPAQRFLLSQPKEKPADNENWMLDLSLANYEFHTEASSLYLQDLELPTEFKPLRKILNLKIHFLTSLYAHVETRAGAIFYLICKELFNWCTLINPPAGSPVLCKWTRGC